MVRRSLLRSIPVRSRPSVSALVRSTLLRSMLAGSRLPRSKVRPRSARVARSARAMISGRGPPCSVPAALPRLTISSSALALSSARERLSSLRSPLRNHVSISALTAPKSTAREAGSSSPSTRPRPPIVACRLSRSASPSGIGAGPSGSLRPSSSRARYRHAKSRTRRASTASLVARPTRNASSRSNSSATSSRRARVSQCTLSAHSSPAVAAAETWSMVRARRLVLSSAPAEVRATPVLSTTHDAAERAPSAAHSNEESNAAVTARPSPSRQAWTSVQVRIHAAMAAPSPGSGSVAMSDANRPTRCAPRSSSPSATAPSNIRSVYRGGLTTTDEKQQITKNLSLLAPARRTELARERTSLTDAHGSPAAKKYTGRIGQLTS